MIPLELEGSYLDSVVCSPETNPALQEARDELAAFQKELLGRYFQGRSVASWSDHTRVGQGYVSRREQVLTYEYGTAENGLRLHASNVGVLRVANLRQALLESLHHNDHEDIKMILLQEARDASAAMNELRGQTEDPFVHPSFPGILQEVSLYIPYRGSIAYGLRSLVSLPHV